MLLNEELTDFLQRKSLILTNQKTVQNLVIIILSGGKLMQVNTDSIAILTKSILKSELEMLDFTTPELSATNDISVKLWLEKRIEQLEGAGV